ncbi:hypothetical protein SD457_21150 [Coprobacillaceae bacterium CR2/5/TPMF4]|nr:hypothetical protein SD457_21150 [Coprobacillaceae bacterium CR2/5/TPMF4]
MEKIITKILSKHLEEIYQISKKLNRYFSREGIEVYYSLIKEPNIAYMLEIADRVEKYMEANNIEFVHGKGKKKARYKNYMTN